MIDLRLNGEGAWADLEDVDIHDAGDLFSVAVLKDGTKYGLPAVCIRIDIDKTHSVIVQCTAREFYAAARAIAARYPEITE